ncbi:MAG: oligoribonuclease [Methylophilaceae bacterium]
MTKNNNNLVWLDMEMTGLDPVNDKIIEIAVIITDPNLEILSEAPVFVIKQDDSLLQNMDAWNTNTHSKSGLIEKVKHSTTSEKDAEDQLINFLKPYVDKNKSPMCGNTICQDRRFMANYMPKLEAYFHYRNLDVSVFKELAKRWRPELIGKFKKSAKHEALADIKESIEELKFYREHFLKIPND